MSKSDILLLVLIFMSAFATRRMFQLCGGYMQYPALFRKEADRAAGCTLAAGITTLVLIVIWFFT